MSPKKAPAPEKPARAELVESGGPGGKTVQQLIDESRLKAAQALPTVVERLIGIVKAPRRNAQASIAAARELIRFAQGVTPAADPFSDSVTPATLPAAVDASIKVLVVDSARLTAELSKRKV